MIKSVIKQANNDTWETKTIYRKDLKIEMQPELRVGKEPVSKGSCCNLMPYMSPFFILFFLQIISVLYKALACVKHTNDYSL